MMPAEMEEVLNRLEAQCQSVTAAVATGDPVVVEQASSQLRQAAQDFSVLMGQLSPEAGGGRALRLRLQKLAAQLGGEREQLLRRSALVDRHLETLLPSTRKNTYAPAGRASAYRSLAS